MFWCNLKQIRIFYGIQRCGNSSDTDPGFCRASICSSWARLLECTCNLFTNRVRLIIIAKKTNKNIVPRYLNVAITFALGNGAQMRDSFEFAKLNAANVMLVCVTVAGICKNTTKRSIKESAVNILKTDLFAIVQV